MGGEVRCLLVVTIVAIIGGFRAENSDVNDGTGIDFPSCNETDSVSCTRFCTRINILEEFSSTIPRSRQDISNVICLDTGQQQQPSASDTILLHGCPSQGYFETNQNTDGVCFVDTQDTSDLQLTPSTMVTGLHSFICLLGSNNSLYSYAIALNDQGDDAILFTDVRVYRYDEDSNPVILTMANETVNVTVTAGHKLTIVARVVTKSPTNGIIKAIASSPLLGENATDQLTTPATGILCNNLGNNEDNKPRIDNKFTGLGRYQLYALEATMDDDQTMIRILINVTSTNETVTIGRINITVHENPSPPVSTTATTELPPKREDDGSATTITVAVVVPLLVVILIIVAIGMAVLFMVLRNRGQGKHNVESIGHTSTDSKRPAPVGDGQDVNRLKVLVYTGDVGDDHPNSSLLRKLQQNDEFRIEQLTITPSFLLDEYISKVSVELNLGTVLVDCGCPGQPNDDFLHKAVKYFTLKPFGSDESSSWKVLRLIHTDGEIDSRSWSPMFDHVEVMYYGELDDEVVNAVVDKLSQCASIIRTSSIDSRNACEQLLQVDKEMTKTIINEIKAVGNRVIDHANKKNQEIQNKIDDVGDNVDVVKTQQLAIMQDVQTQAKVN